MVQCLKVSGKWLMAIVAVVFASVLLSVTVLAAETEKGQISVSGKGVVTVEPDVAVINVYVSTRAATAEEAQKENIEISARVIEALKEAGIKDEDIKTEMYEVYPRYKYDDKTQESKIQYFMGTHDLSVKTKDIKNTGKYLDIAIKNGAMSAGNISFSVEDPNQYYAEALTLAIGNAKNSASIIAQAIDMTMGNPILVQENYSQNSYYRSAMDTAADDRAVAEAAGADGGNIVDIRYDKIDITANVNVTYQFE